MQRKYNVTPLKRWNKILKIIIDDYKKNNIPYDIKQVRQLASIVYVDYKKIAVSKLPKKKVIQTAKKDSNITLKATDVPNYWFDNQANFTYYFQVGDWANQFSNAYPTIPVMLITKKTEKKPLVVQGAEGDYDGSIFQRWVEDIRDGLPNAEDYAEIGYFFGTPAYFNGKLYAVWFEDGVKIPKVAPPINKVEPRKKRLIEDAEEREKKRREIEKPKRKRGRPKKSEEEKKKPLPKKPKKEEKPKKKVIEKPTANRVTEIRNLIADFRQDLKDGLITKKFYQEQVAILTSKLEDGGIV
jgi:hypothetical protein